jgi:hypothetical protein
MSSMLDYHTPHLSLPARGHGEGGAVLLKCWMCQSDDHTCYFGVQRVQCMPMLLTIAERSAPHHLCRRGVVAGPPAAGCCAT